jgi:hypothetical protein
VRHLTEEDLILLRYQEAESPAELQAHLAECAACRQAEEALRLTLAAVDEAAVPERGEGYGAEVWQRLAPKLVPSKARVLRFPTRRTWLALLASAAGLLVAFETGRHWSPPEPPVAAAPSRDRILLVAVGDHLQRSQLVLVELVNAQQGVPLDVSAEREIAQNLVANSRLYRQTAASTGEAGVASVLDDLERVLVEVANGPATLSSKEVGELRQRIESKGILFKVRVLGSQVREREKGPARERTGQKT